MSQRPNSLDGASESLVGAVADLPQIERERGPQPGGAAWPDASRHNRVRYPAKITATGHYLPPRIVTNDELAQRVDTTSDWIIQRTGILRRHFVEPGVATSDLAAQAAVDLLARRKITADEIDLIIIATVTPDMFFPSTACLVQRKIDARRAWGFDLSGACSGFLYGLSVGAQFIESGTHSKVLVIGADVMSNLITPEDRATYVLFGDGAGAVLLEPGESEHFGILGQTQTIDGAGEQFLCMPGGGSLHPPTHETVERKMHQVHQDGRAVFKYAVLQMEHVSRRLLEKHRLKCGEIDLFIPHQANLRIIDAVAERLGLEHSRVVRTVAKYGNTGAATIPIALCDAVAAGQLRPGHMVLLAAAGAGFTSGAALMRWAA